MASSNDVQEKIDHGKKEQVEKTQGEASNGKGQANFGPQHGETQARQESRQEDAAEGEEKGSGEGKEGREESGA